MTALPTPPGGFDGRPELREFIYEQLGLLQRHAEIAQSFAAAGDDVGLRYGLTRLRAHWRATVETFNDLAAADRAEALQPAKHVPPEGEGKSLTAQLSRAVTATDPAHSDDVRPRELVEAT